MRRPEHIDEQVVEHDLQPDVRIQQRRHAARHQLDRIDGGMPAVGRDPLIGRIERVLALVRIHEDAEHEIEAVDERFGTDQRFPKVHRPRHFAEELDEDDGAAEAVDGRHDGRDGDGEADVREDARGGSDGGVREDAEGGVGPLGCGFEDAGVGDHAHDGEDAEGVEPDGEVGNPGEAAKGTDLAEDHAYAGGFSQLYHQASLSLLERITSKCPYEAQHDEAHGTTTRPSYDLLQRKSVDENNDADIEKELRRLQHRHQRSGNGTVDSEDEVCICSDGVAIRIQPQKQFPQHQTAIGCKTGEDGVYDYTWAITQLS